MPQSYHLTCLVLTIPVSTSSVERSFSALKRIKTAVHGDELASVCWCLSHSSFELWVQKTRDVSLWSPQVVREGVHSLGAAAERPDHHGHSSYVGLEVCVDLNEVAHQYSFVSEAEKGAEVLTESSVRSARRRLTSLLRGVEIQETAQVVQSLKFHSAEVWKSTPESIYQPGVRGSRDGLSWELGVVQKIHDRRDA
ncbi:unnamed protein product [Boreogadus saida]